MSFDRRSFIGGTIASGIALGAGGCIPPDQSPSGRFVSRLRLIEAEANGTLGVELFDVATGLSVGLNRSKRFGHCSSFKMSLAALVLLRDAQGIGDADRTITWSEDDLMFVSPFTTRRLSEGASLRELAEATQRYSDNAAANILLREIGGPQALTAFWRSIGDDASRLDRYEPELNNVPVTEYRDTTTPQAMARSVARLTYGDVLHETERATLRQWMVDTPTGRRRVRAGLPEEWRAGDKTGTTIWPGVGSIYVDIGFVEVPTKEGEAPRGPFTFATYLRTDADSGGMDAASEAVLAQVGEVLVQFTEKDDLFPF